MANLGNSRGSLNDIHKKVSKEINDFKSNIRSDIESQVNNMFSSGMQFDADVDNIDINLNINDAKIRTNIKDSVQKKINKEVGEIEIKQIKGIDLTKYINFDKNKLKNHIDEAYKAALKSTATDADSKKFIGAAMVGLSQGLDLEKPMKEYLADMQEYYGITEKFIDEINAEIAKIDFSPVTKQVDTVAEAADKIETAHNKIAKSIQKFNKRNQSKMYEGKPEQLVLSNSKSGYSIEVNNNEVGGTSKEHYKAALGNAQEKVDSVLHSHPNELTAAFSFDDIETAIAHKIDGIIHEYVLSIEDISVLDISKFSSEQLKQISDYIKKNAFIHEDGFAPTLNEYDAFDKIIKNNIEDYINDVVDVFVREIQSENKNVNVSSIKSKIMDSIAKSSMESYKDYDNFYDQLYDKLLASTDSLKIKNADTLADYAVTSILSKSQQLYQENFLKEAIGKFAPELKLDEVYKKTKLKDYFDGESLLPEIKTKQVEEASDDLKKSLKKVGETAQEVGDESSKGISKIGEAADEAREKVEKLEEAEEEVSKPKTSENSIFFKANDLKELAEQYKILRQINHDIQLYEDPNNYSDTGLGKSFNAIGLKKTGSSYDELKAYKKELLELNPILDAVADSTENISKKKLIRMFGSEFGIESERIAKQATDAKELIDQYTELIGLNQRLEMVKPESSIAKRIQEERDEIIKLNPLLEEYIEHTKAIITPKQMQDKWNQNSISQNDIVSSSQNNLSEELKSELGLTEELTNAEENLTKVRTKRKIAPTKSETSEELKQETQQAEQATQAEETLHKVRTKRKIASSNNNETADLKKEKAQVEALTTAQEKLNEAKQSESKTTWKDTNNIQDLSKFISQMDLAKKSTSELKEMFSKIQNMQFDPNNEQDILAYRSSVEKLNQAFTELGFKFNETSKKWIKAISSSDEFKAAMKAQADSTKKAVQAQEELIQKQQEVSITDKVSQNIKSEKIEVEQVADAEIKALKPLSDTINDIAKAVDHKTERFKEERKDVVETVDTEISRLKELRSELDKINNDEKNTSKTNKFTLSTSDELTSLTDLYNLINNIIIAVKEKTQAFNEEGLEVTASVKAENDALSFLLETLKQIASTVKEVKIPAGEKLQWANDLRKLNAEDIEKIGTNLNIMYQSISKLNVKDSNFIKQLNDILAKSKELKDLATVLSSTKKNIESAKQATMSQKEKDKDKDSKASYQKSLSMIKEQLKLKHEIDMAVAKGDGSDVIVSAKNNSLIQMLDKQIEAEKKLRQQRRITNQEYWNQLRAEKSAIEQRYKAEVEAANQVASVISKQNITEKSISQLESLRSRLEKALKSNLMPESANDIEAQLSKIKTKLDDIENKKIDITDPQEQADLEKLAEQVSEVQKNLEKTANAAKASSLRSDIAGYLTQNTKLTKEFKSQLKALQDQLESGKLSGSQLQKIVEEFNNIKTAARQAGLEGANFFDKLSNRMSDMDAKFIAQFLSWQDLLRYIRQTAQEVIKVDTALTELRKVSDASTERLEQSFQRSSETAQELGASISDVINITADWSRLGYSVDEAEGLARVTTLFQTVGDNMTAESASETMISTLKAYSLGVDQAEHIVDQYNEVKLLVAPLCQTQIWIGCSCIGCI